MIKLRLNLELLQNYFFFEYSVRIPISTVKNNYILSQYNAADLSMLSNFEVLKEKLSIVNKSFLTLGKPLRS